MIKRLIVAAIAVVFFVLQFNLNGASALELDHLLPIVEAVSLCKFI